MRKNKTVYPQLSNTDIRRIILQYFYDRNKNATSIRGKGGSSVKISDIKSDLKAQYNLTPKQVVSNLNYLISQGWVEERVITKQVVARGGTLLPSDTKYYQITAAGIDKIEGPGEFTMPKFHGINIQATGQNIITLGDGNQIDAQFGDLGKALVELRAAITNSNVPEANKMDLIVDIDTIQSQLAKPEPNRNIITLAWISLQAAAAIDGCANLVQKVAGLIAPLLI